MPRRKKRRALVPRRKKRRASIQFSFRVIRADGRPITGREVVAVLAFFVDQRREPDNYRIEATDWARTVGRSTYEGAPHSAKEAREAMLEHFWYVLKDQGLQRLRLGRVR